MPEFAADAQALWRAATLALAAATLLAGCGGGGSSQVAAATESNLIPLGQSAGPLPLTRHCGFSADTWQTFFEGEFALDLLRTTPICALRNCDIPLLAGQPVAVDALLRMEGGPSTWAFACLKPDAAAQVVQGLPSPNLKNLEGWYCFSLWGKPTYYAPAPTGLVLQAAADIRLAFKQAGTVLSVGQLVLVGENEFYWPQYQATYFTRTALLTTVPGVEVE